MKASKAVRASALFSRSTKYSVPRPCARQARLRSRGSGRGQSAWLPAAAAEGEARQASASRPRPQPGRHFARSRPASSPARRRSPRWRRAWQGAHWWPIIFGASRREPAAGTSARSTEKGVLNRLRSEAIVRSQCIWIVVPMPMARPSTPRHDEASKTVHRALRKPKAAGSPTARGHGEGEEIGHVVAGRETALGAEEGDGADRACPRPPAALRSCGHTWLG